MLTTQQWLARIAETSGLSYENVRDLQGSYVTLLTNRLSKGREVVVPFVGCLMPTLRDTYLAEVKGGEVYIIPPRVELRLLQNPPEGWRKMAEIISESGSLIPRKIYGYFEAFESVTMNCMAQGEAIAWDSLGILTPLPESPICYSFIPDVILWESVNKPFSFYEPMLLQEGKTFPQLKLRKVETLEETQIIMPLYPEEKVPSSSISEVEDEDSIPDKNEKSFYPRTTPPPLPFRISSPQPPVAQIESVAPISDSPFIMPEPKLPPIPTKKKDSGEDSRNRKSRRLAVFVLIVIVFLLGLLVVFFVRDVRRTKNPQSVSEAKVAMPSIMLPDSLSDVAPVLNMEDFKGEESPINSIENTSKTPLPELVMVVRGSTLASMALNHYGNKIYWVYIYEENRSSINNPHRVPIGTTLRLPPREKYGIDDSLESLSRARKKEREILKKYPV